MSSKTTQLRRLNILVQEPLAEWVTTSAAERGISTSALIRDALERERIRQKEEAIEYAAEALADAYLHDPELTALTALDVEDFL